MTQKDVLTVRRNGRQIAKVVVFAAVGNGFQILGISPVSDSHAGDLTMPCHIHRLLLFYNGLVRQLIAGNLAIFLHKTDDPLCIGISLGNLIESLLNKFVSVQINLPLFALVFASRGRLYNILIGANEVFDNQLFNQLLRILPSLGMFLYTDPDWFQVWQN